MKKTQKRPIWLDQQNGFDPAAFLHSFLRLVKGTAKPTTCHINMMQLLLPIVSDWPIRWFSISSLPPIYSPSFSFMGGVAKK
jgi:hypothetical protein